MTKVKVTQEHEDSLVDALSSAPLNQVGLSYNDMTGLIMMVREYGEMSRKEHD